MDTIKYLQFIAAKMQECRKVWKLGGGGASSKMAAKNLGGHSTPPAFDIPEMDSKTWCNLGIVPIILKSYLWFIYLDTYILGTLHFYTFPTTLHCEKETSY